MPLPRDPDDVRGRDNLARKDECLHSAAMLGLLPAPLHRQLLRVAHAARLRIWGLLRLEIRGTNVLAFDHRGHVLLVRHSYHMPDSWMFPGGGLARGEAPAQTGMRELAEETGCRLDQATWFATSLRPMKEGWTNRIELIAGTTTDSPRADGRELSQAGFFALDALPENIGIAALDYIRMWREWRADQTDEPSER